MSPQVSPVTEARRTPSSTAGACRHCRHCRMHLLARLSRLQRRRFTRRAPLALARALPAVYAGGLRDVGAQACLLLRIQMAAKGAGSSLRPKVVGPRLQPQRKRVDNVGARAHARIAHRNHQSPTRACIQSHTHTITIACAFQKITK